jgi:hypothetical protein
LCLTVHDGECFILFQLQIYMLYTQLYDHYRTKLADEVLQYFQHDPCDRSAPGEQLKMRSSGDVVAARPRGDAGWPRPCRKHAATSAALRAASEAQLSASDARIAITTEAASPAFNEPSTLPREHGRLPASYSTEIARAASRRRKERFGEHLPPTWSTSARASRVVNLPSSTPTHAPTPRSRPSPRPVRADVSRRYYVAEVVVPWADITQQVEAEFEAAQATRCAGKLTDCHAHEGPAMVVHAGASMSASTALEEAEAAADALLVADGRPRGHPRAERDELEPQPAAAMATQMPEPRHAARLPVRPPLPHPPMDVVKAPDPVESQLESAIAHLPAVARVALASVPEASAEHVANAAAADVCAGAQPRAVGEIEALRAQVSKSDQTIAVLRAQIRVRDTTIAQLEEQLAIATQAGSPSCGRALAEARNPAPSCNEGQRDGHGDGDRERAAFRVPGTKEESATLLNRLAAIKARWVPSPGLGLDHEPAAQMP